MCETMKSLKEDFFASIVVFLVALPLCLGIALASGAPLVSGLIAGIIGGIVVGFLSGSSLGVSGPGAGLAAVVLYSIHTLGSFESFLFAVVISGFMQIIFGLAQAGYVRYFFPQSVIKGMLAGIGVVIILKQIPHLFGYNSDPEGDFAFFQVDGHTTLNELFYMFERIDLGSVLISFFALFILVTWDKLAKHLSKVVPASLFAVLAGILLNFLFQKTGFLVLSEDQLVNIVSVSSLPDFFSKLTGPDFTVWQDPKIYFVAFLIALVASLETLLCLEATDKLDPQKRKTSADRELLAQGVGNMVSGFIGGLPLTQVIVRSSANIHSGGKTKTSTILHGFFLLFFVVYAGALLNQIPIASLAAILLLVGYKLSNPDIFKESLRENLSYSTSFFTTVLGVVFSNLLLGIFLGFIVFHCVGLAEKRLNISLQKPKKSKVDSI